MNGMEPLLMLAAVYIIPTVVALVKGHKNTAAIFIVNLFLGWTVLGWVVSLAWAFIDQQTRYERC
jgi:uncharacterized membrane protein YqaE (UPF0057 family)